MYRRTVSTPTGPFTFVQQSDALVASHWGGAFVDDTDLLQEAERQLAAYFSGDQKGFDLPVDLSGLSESQQRICRAIAAIPFGETLEYGDLSRALNIPAQAIGQGCGRNPLPVIIPCHRVLSVKGLGGFSGDGGVETKVWLLKHEGAAGLLI